MNRWQMSLVVGVGKCKEEEKKVGKAECIKVKAAKTLTKKKKTKWN